MIWPALYVTESLWKFWFLVIGTIFIELFTIKFFIKFSWQKSFLISLIGNSVSGVVGTIAMMWAMLFLHLIVGHFVPNGTFSLINWVATYILMCIGSVFIETLTIKIIYKETLKRLFPPMMIGNVLSYSFIAFTMITATNKDPDEASFIKYKYLPNKQSFVLLDGSSAFIKVSTIRVSFDKANHLLNNKKHPTYNLIIPFNKSGKNHLFDFNIPGRNDQGGISDSIKELRFSELNDEYKVVFEQKNPDTLFGWSKPINTDTLTFKRLKI